MTREMNKPENVRCRCFECKPYSKPECWQCSKAEEKSRTLNPDVAEFVQVLNERLKK